MPENTYTMNELKSMLKMNYNTLKRVIENAENALDITVTDVFKNGRKLKGYVINDSNIKKIKDFCKLKGVENAISDLKQVVSENQQLKMQLAQVRNEKEKNENTLNMRITQLEADLNIANTKVLSIEDKQKSTEKEYFSLKSENTKIEKRCFKLSIILSITATIAIISSIVAILTLVFH